MPYDLNKAVRMRNLKALAERVAENGASGEGGSMTWPPKDGNTYGVKDGKYTVILYKTGTTDILPPAVEEANKTGEVSVRFFIPFKYAMNQTRTALNDVAHLGWRFPFAEGRIKKVSVKAKVPGGTALDVLIDGSSVLTTAKTVTNAWVDYEVNTLITLNQAVELYVTQSFTAEDLEVMLLIEVGNASIEFVGEPDLEPNVYATGQYAATWGSSGQEMSDGFRTIYMPSVNKLKTFVYGWGAQADDGKWYICGGADSSPKYDWDLKKALGTEVTLINTPIEFPISDVVDIVYTHCYYSTTYIKSTGILLCEDATLKRTDGGTHAVEVSCFNDKSIAYSNTSAKAAGTHIPCSLTNNHVFWIGCSSSNVWYKETTQDIGNIKQISGFYILTQDNKLYFPDKSSEYEPKTWSEITHNLGAIKKIWGDAVQTGTSTFTPGAGKLFVLTADNTLYAKGTGSSGQLGLPRATYNTLTEVGVFDVKKIEGYNTMTFLLTHDGKLYYTGYNGSRNDLPHTGAYVEGFVRVYENYYFHDIAFVNNTLVAIAERLGDMPE